MFIKWFWTIFSLGAPDIINAKQNAPLDVP